MGVSDNLVHPHFSRINQPTKIKLSLTLKPRGHADKNCCSGSHCSHYKLVKIFQPTLQCNDCQQLDSAIVDVPLQALGLDEGFYGMLNNPQKKKNDPLSAKIGRVDCLFRTTKKLHNKRTLTNKG